MRLFSGRRIFYDQVVRPIQRNNRIHSKIGPRSPLGIAGSSANGRASLKGASHAHQTVDCAAIKKPALAKMLSGASEPELRRNLHCLSHAEGVRSLKISYRMCECYCARFNHSLLVMQVARPANSEIPIILMPNAHPSANYG